MRFYPFKGLESLEEWEERTKDRVFIPNKFWYLNSYSIEIYLSRGIPLNNVEFIGNFKIKRPKDEFLTENLQLYFNNPKTTFNYFINRLIKDYKDNNLMESSLYTKEGLEKTRIANEKALEDVKELNQFTQRMRKGEEVNDILKDMYGNKNT